MTLAAGSRLGPYEIVAPLGAGGMGEVYRARDPKLRREVALKVLPDQVARDPERLARFEREAHVLASLNHPNIAAIYGLEEADGVRALVMELVEGPTLAEHLERGALPLDESLAIARQIADALEDAHEHGIVHRDLKPANVKISPSGKVKVLDFGLAKAMEIGSGFGSASQLANSPTITHGATQLGTILGTAAYMAPEQAKGKPADKRADIWAFGVVVFEMLTGRRLFTGETVSETLAEVLKTQIDWTALPDETPQALRQLLRRVLERDPRNRLHDIADARIVLDEVASGRMRGGWPRAGGCAFGSGTAGREPALARRLRRGGGRRRPARLLREGARCAAGCSTTARDPARVEPGAGPGAELPVRLFARWREPRLLGTRKRAADSAPPRSGPAGSGVDPRHRRRIVRFLLTRWPVARFRRGRPADENRGRGRAAIPPRRRARRRRRDLAQRRHDRLRPDLLRRPLPGPRRRRARRSG